MNVWHETSLGEVCDKVGGLIQTGPFGSQLHQSDYSEQGIPVVMPKDIVGGRISSETVARVSSDHVNRLSRHKLSSGDIVYGRRGDIGRQALIRPEQAGWMCGTGCLRISLGESILNPLFLHYYLSQDEVIGWITNQAIGATMPNLNTGILRSVPVRYPRLPIQRRIAGILSAYDDLIENSQRRIKILEEMARRLYREWFVHFRFPGHEDCRFVDSPLGEIPEGWEAGRLDDVLVLQRGFDLPKSQRVDGQVPIYAATGVTGFHDTAMVMAPGVVTGRSGSIGEVVYVHEDFWPLNTALWVKEFPRSEPLYAYFLLASLDLKQFNSGAAVPTLNRNDIHGLSVLIPPRGLQQNFQRVAGALLLQARTHSLQIENLRRTRDLLLPRLLSGQIDVEALDHA